MLEIQYLSLNVSDLSNLIMIMPLTFLSFFQKEQQSCFSLFVDDSVCVDVHCICDNNMRTLPKHKVMSLGMYLLKRKRIVKGGAAYHVNAKNIGHTQYS